MKEKTNVAGLVSKAIDACGDKESLFAIHSYGDGGNVAFAGNPRDIANGFAYVIVNGIKHGAKPEERKLANSLFNGILHVLSVGDKLSQDLANILADIMIEASKEIVERKRRENENKEKAEKHAAAPSSFDPNSKVCLACDEYTDCATRRIKENLSKLKNMLNKDANGKKNKNARKHGTRK